MSKILVAFFSAEGNTRKVAAAFSKITGGELFEIKPVEPYSKADINWLNPVSRCNKEKIGKKDVPVEGKVEDFESFDTVFLGFPIWYYGAPNVVNTFVKDYDWSGKKIVLFATSGSSNLNKTAEKLEPYLKGDYEIVAQKLVKPADTSADLKAFAAEALK
ncbi:MAG: NAD(P)H-dependent oxidoreductase [Ruminococcus sp.]|nr:NAD(P)H-dependent oxidoreductase [Ruminococcus sp.]